MVSVAPGLSPVDSYMLNRLVWEFREELSEYLEEDLFGAERSQDQPYFQFREVGAYLAFDANLSEDAYLERTRLQDSVCVLDTLVWIFETSVELEGRGQFGKGPAFDQDLIFTRREYSEEDTSAPDAPGSRGWKSGTAEVERAYIRHALGPVEVHVGRDRFWWGPGRFGTLIVSSNGPALDMLGVSVRFRGVSARGFTAVLSPEEGIYLSAHRFSVQLPLRTVFGFTETVVYHRSSFPELQYVNPLIPYYLAEHNLGQDDNTLWNFSLVTHPGAGVRLYGEFLIDDVQYQRSARAPDKLGGIAGIHIADPLGIPDSDLKCEYTRLNKWVYTHRDTKDKYVNSGVPIGEPLGPDSDRLALRLCHRPAASLEIGLGYTYCRHGEGTVNVPWEDEDGEARPPFPSGQVEMFNRLIVDLMYRPVWWFCLEGEVDYERARNASFFGVCPEKAVDRWQWDLALRLDI